MIFGIGKAHDLQRQNGRTTVRKYFAYSVCFDSTGVYRSLGVLCDTSNREQYYADLERNIIAQIEERINAGQTVTDCVIHTPFRMRNDEMKTIKESIDKLHKSHGDITFTVMRINTVIAFSALPTIISRFHTSQLMFNYLQKNILFGLKV